MESQNLCTEPSREPPHPWLLFCLWEAKAQQAQLHFQGPIGVESEAVQLDVSSLLPLQETRQTVAARALSPSPAHFPESLWTFLFRAQACEKAFLGGRVVVAVVAFPCFSPRQGLSVQVVKPGHPHGRPHIDAHYPKSVLHMPV